MGYGFIILHRSKVATFWQPGEIHSTKVRKLAMEGWFGPTGS
jgi:hypothetical protein